MRQAASISKLWRWHAMLIYQRHRDTLDDLQPPQAENQGTMGVDLGITALSKL